MIEPTNSGKTRYLVNLLSSTLRGKFHHIFLICPTFIQNITYDGFRENDKDLLILTPLQDQIVLRTVVIHIYPYEGTNILIIRDECAALRDVKQRTNELVNLAFSARHTRISVRGITQQTTRIEKPFREKTAALVLLYTPSAKDMKITFENYVDEWTRDEQKENATLLILASNWMLGLAEPVPSHSWGTSVRDESSIVFIVGRGTERNKPSQLTQRCLLVNRFCLKNGMRRSLLSKGLWQWPQIPKKLRKFKEILLYIFLFIFSVKLPSKFLLESIISCWINSYVFKVRKKGSRG